MIERAKLWALGANSAEKHMIARASEVLGWIGGMT